MLQSTYKVNTDNFLKRYFLYKLKTKSRKTGKVFYLQPKNSPFRPIQLWRYALTANPPLVTVYNHPLLFFFSLLKSVCFSVFVLDVPRRKPPKSFTDKSDALIIRVFQPSPLTNTVVVCVKGKNIYFFLSFIFIFHNEIRDIFLSKNNETVVAFAHKNNDLLSVK